MYTTLYHKPTFTGVYLNWTSLTSRKYKIGLIKCLLDRIWKICSEEVDKEFETEKLKNILLKNEYPIQIIDTEFEKFIKRKTMQPQPQTQPLTQTPENPQPPPQAPTPDQPNNSSQPQLQEQQSQRRFTRSQLKSQPQLSSHHSSQPQLVTQPLQPTEQPIEPQPPPPQPPPPPPTPPTPPPPTPPPTTKQKKYIVLPFSNYKAEKFETRLTMLVNETFPQVELRVAFRAPNTIGNMFPYKDNVKDPYLQSHVVYKITCETCGAQYIGITERIVFHRMKEHNSKKTGKKETAIQMHKEEFPEHQINALDFEVIDRADTKTKLMLKEMLHINKSKPILNTQHAAKYKNDKDTFNKQLNTIIIARQI